MENVCALIGDNCNTNRAMSSSAGVPLIGCANHRFNLAAKEIVSEDEDLLVRINSVMLKLKNLVFAAKLRKLTPLAAKTRNATRWSSTFQMMLRYQRIREFVPTLDSEELDDLMLLSSESRRLDAMVDQLKNVESVTKTLQDTATTMSDVRDMFDSIMEDYPETEIRLSATAPIVHKPTFESAVVKVQRGEGQTMTHEEITAVRRFEIPHAGGPSCATLNLSYAQRALRRRLNGPQSVARKYINLDFLQPTSNACERFFSKAGYVFNERRRALTPANLEYQMFLHCNKDLWGPSDFTNLPHVNDDDE